jgi:transcriptional regulator with XRE-family HTH domain
MSLAHQSSRPRAGHHGATLRLAAGGHDLGGGQAQDGGHARENLGAGKPAAGVDQGHGWLGAKVLEPQGSLAHKVLQGWHVPPCSPTVAHFKNFSPTVAHKGLTVDLPSPGYVGAMPADGDRVRFGAAMRAAREARGLTQKAAGQLIGISQRWYSKIERGEYPALEHKAAILAALGMSLPDPQPAPVADVNSQILDEIREIRADIALLLRAAATAGDKDILNLLDRRDAPQATANTRPIAVSRGSRDGL